MARRRKFAAQTDSANEASCDVAVESGAATSSSGNRIALVRGKQTQGELAAELGVHVNTLRRYETGARLPDAEFLLAMVRVKRVSPTWLLLGIGPEIIPDEPFAKRPLTRDEIKDICRELYRAVANLPDKTLPLETRQRLLGTIFEQGLLLAEQRTTSLGRLFGTFAIAISALVSGRDSG